MNFFSKLIFLLKIVFHAIINGFYKLKRNNDCVIQTNL